MKKLLVWALFFYGALCAAHEVHLTKSSQAATVLELRYANNDAFAFEAYELFLPTEEIPEQVGRTNKNGQIIFLAGNTQKWRVKAYSKDGHGLDEMIEIDNVAPLGFTVNKSDAKSLPRFLLFMIGLAVLLTIFSSLHFLTRKKRLASKTAGL